ncbi:MAG: protein tyrosine phosphatase [Hyphomicrobiaceae bacterium]
MQKFAKNQRRAVRRVVRNWRLNVAERTPLWLRRTFGPAVKYADMLLVDHGIFRLAYLNRHKLGEHAWRSAQPAPGQLSSIARLGVRTVVNLRGARVCGGYWLEQQACARLGVRLVDFQIRSRAAPSKEELFAARAMLDEITYPALFHCKSGADRAGLMSTLYLIVRENMPVRQALSQLNLRFGHIRQSDTGILDYFFERYLADTADKEMPFFEWVEKVYDPDELKRTFHSNRWANLLTGTILRRE